KRQFRVDENAKGKRLDLVVDEALGLSRAKLKALFDEGLVRVDGRRVKKGQLAEAGQEVSVEVSQAPRQAAPDAGAPLSVLYGDEALVFVDKPAGIPSHPLEPGELGTVANALVARYPECALASEDPREGGLCHRLDTGTSGVLAAARTREAWLKVREAFGGEGVDKRYWALTTGPLADEGEIDLPLRHGRADRVAPAAGGGPDAREARSSFKVLSRSGEYSLVEVRIHTGVLHQVRAHLAAIGAPVVGDALYGGRPEPGLARFFLHARRLSLAHPLTGEAVSVESPLPDELRRTLAAHGMTAP
ncbi:MAG: RluA family pseudouridine synthase, partial [Myxococcaceae bacterium]